MKNTTTPYQVNLASIDQTNFNVNEYSLIGTGEKVFLITPMKMGCGWNEDNINFRSLLVNTEGFVVSSGLPKFFNWGEQDALRPVPTSLKGCQLIEKLDGSLLTVTRYKGQWISRTRGTVNATETLANGDEIDYLKLKYPLIWDESANDGMDTWDHSLIFEWTTPSNRIILNYGDEPELHLIARVSHNDFALASQDELDELAAKLEVNRPKTYTEFTSVKDCLKVVSDFKGQEGICLYSRNGQRIHKIKGAQYLMLHRMKSNLSSLDKVVDVFYLAGKPSYLDFYKYIEDSFDFELAEYCKVHMSTICDANKEVQKIILGMKSFLDSKVKHLTSRKEQAMVIVQAYGKTNRSSFLFHMLDGHEFLTDDQEKKLLFQVIDVS